jgi:signal transduction histidine kinase
VDGAPFIAVTTAFVELGAGLVVATAFVRRRRNREYGVATLLAIAAALHSAGSLALSHHGGHAFGPLGHALVLGGLALALALAVHFALASLPEVAPGWATSAAYLGGAVATLVDTVPRGVLQATMASSRLELGRHAQAADDVAVTFASVIAAAVVLVIVTRLYWAGHRTMGAVVAGTFVLFLAAAHDVTVAVGLRHDARWVDIGLAALLTAIATTPSAKYAVVAVELERSEQELRSRTRELRRSYEDLHTAQEELLKKEQLAVVGELAAVIAHEVRNPLAIIANAGAGLRKPAITRDDYEVLLAILDEETSRLNRLVTDLLRYARPVNIQRSQFLLAELLERALALPDRSKEIQLALQIEAHEARLWGDANLLRQVFDNLIDNAVQAMGPGGSLTVRVRPAVKDGADGLDVAFIDTGEGMDTQVRSRALDPFFTTRPSGTGLGLAIVDRIIDAHGGRLDIDSRAGEGTTVTVFVPHGSPSEPPAGRRSSRPSLENRRRPSERPLGRPNDFNRE